MRRALVGQLEHVAGQIAKVAALADEARQLADRVPGTRWSAGRIADVGRALEAVGDDVRELRADLLVAGGARAVTLPGGT